MTLFRLLDSPLKDKKFIIIGVPTVTIINFFITYPIDYFSPIKILDFSWDLFSTFWTWIIARIYIVHCYYQYQDKNQPFQHLFQQLIGASLVAIPTSILFYFVQTLLFSKSMLLIFFTQDLLVIELFVIVLNLIYFIRIYQTYLSKSLPSSFPQKTNIFASRGKQKIILPLDDTLGFLLEHKIIKAIMNNGDVYLVDGSLQQLEHQLPPFFMRINRQWIVSRNMVSSYTRIENDKLKVILSGTSTPIETIVSRAKSAAFKKWIQHS